MPSSPSNLPELRRESPRKPQTVRDRDRVIGFDLVNALDAANAVDPRTITGDEYRRLIACRLCLSRIIDEAGKFQ